MSQALIGLEMQQKLTKCCQQEKAGLPMILPEEKILIYTVSQGYKSYKKWKKEGYKETNQETFQYKRLKVAAMLKKDWNNLRKTEQNSMLMTQVSIEEEFHNTTQEV